MAPYRTCLFVSLFAFCLAAPSAAEDAVVDGPDGCLALRGEWIPPATCDLRHLVVEPGDRVMFESTVTFTTSGPLFNYGRLEVRGNFLPSQEVTNRGTLIMGGLTVNSATLANEGTLINRGWLHNHAGVVNRAVFLNQGFFETCNGALVNHAFMRSTGDIENWGSMISNLGILVNEGRLYNPDGDTYVVHNTGGLENLSTVENGGTLRNTCGAALYGAGTVSGVDPIYDPCDPALALQLLTTRVLDSGQFALGSLTKKDVRLLSGHLARAAKALGVGDAAAAAGWVEQFSADVQAVEAEGRIAPPLAAAYVGWADRLVALLSS